MSSDFDNVYGKFGSGNTKDKSTLKKIYKNPSNYTQEEIKKAFYGALDRPGYRERNSNSWNMDYWRNIGSDDDDWVKDTTKLGIDTNAYENALTRLLIRAGTPKPPAPAPAPTPTKPKEKKPPLTGGRGENGTSAPVPGSDQDPTRYKGLTAAEYEDFIDKREYEQQIGLNNQDARSRALIQSLRNESAKEVESIRSTASMYGADRAFDATDVSSRRDKEARMYVADRGKEATLDKAKIDGVFGVKMQNIIARGAEDVEKIRGEYGLSAQRIAGEYGLERDRIQGATARDVANRNRDAQIFSSLMSGFWS